MFGNLFLILILAEILNKNWVQIHLNNWIESLSRARNYAPPVIFFAKFSQNGCK